MIVKEILINSFRILKKNSFLNVFDFAYSTIKSFKNTQDEKDINIIGVCEYSLDKLSPKLIQKNGKKIKELTEIMLIETQVEFKRQMNNEFNENLFLAKDNLNKTLEDFDRYLQYNQDLKEYFLSGNFTKQKDDEIEQEMQIKMDKLKDLQDRQDKIKDIFNLVNS